jgi:hypothetical protein
MDRTRTRRSVGGLILTAAVLGIAGILVLSDGPISAQSVGQNSRPWSCWTQPTSGGTVFRGAAVDPVCAAPIEVSALTLALSGKRSTAGAILLPRPPTELSIKRLRTTITLAWSAASIGPAPTSFVFQAGSASGLSDVANVDTESPLSTLTATGVPPGRYFVRILARNVSGTSAPSRELVVTVPDTCSVAPGPPTGLTAVVNGTTVMLTWQPPGGGCPVISYTIEAGSALGSSNLATLSTGNAANSLTVTNVASGTYFVRVRAASAGGTSASSNEVQLTVLPAACTAPPGPPTDFAARVTGTSVVLSWRAGAGFPSSYVVEVGLSPGISDLVVSDTGSAATSLVANGVALGTYYVRIRSRNLCGASLPSSEAIVVVVGDTSGWTLIWSEECNGPSRAGVDPARWLYDIGTSYPNGPGNWGTGEVEFMSRSTDNVYQDGNGHCAIAPLHQGSSPTTGWTSGRIETHAAFAAPGNGRSL